MSFPADSTRVPAVAPLTVTTRAELVPREASLLELTRRGSRLALGGASLVAAAGLGALSRAASGGSLAPPETGLLSGAALGLALEAQRIAFDAALVAERAGRSVTRLAGSIPPVRRRVVRVAAALEPWRARGIAERDRLQADALAFVDALVPRVADAIVARVDLDAIVQRVPIDDVLDRLDFDAIVDRLDLTGIIADSTEGIAGETVDAVRYQAMRIDGLAARVVDAVLRRRGGRALPTRESRAPR